MKINIDYSRDKLLDDYAIEILKDRYLIEGEKSPQDAFARAARTFADDTDHAQRLYDYASNLWFMFATPVLANAGSRRGFPISCFLSAIPDSRKGILDHYTENGWLSSMGGGIGTYVGNLRSDGTATASGSRSTGSIPFLKVVDAQMLAFSQGVSRRGAYAAYQDISHPEIEEFLVFRKPTGGDSNRKCLNLHHAVNIPDSFMQIIEKATTDNSVDDSWPLIDPHTKKVTKVVSAKELWMQILRLRLETGEPYLHFTDTTNRLRPDVLKILGLEIKNSNLCVAPETLVLTEHGHLPIQDLVDKEIKVWNGKEFSTVIPRKTSDNAELITIKFSDGSELSCTEYHKFYIQKSYWPGSVVVKAAYELNVGDKLEKWDLPLVKSRETYIDPKAYSQGFYSADGNTDLEYSWLYSTKYVCEIRLTGTFGEEHASTPRKMWRHGLMNAKDWVPVNKSLDYKLNWLAGLLDGDGTVVKSEKADTLQIASVNKVFLHDIKLMLQEMGVHSKINNSRDAGNYSMPDGRGGMKEYPCQATYRLLIGTEGVQKLNDLGLVLERLVLRDLQEANRSALHFVKVVGIEKTGRHDATYCFTEPKRGRGMFNGIVTGNCTEITLPTTEDRTAVCCLSSVNLEYYDEWRDTNMVQDIIRMLDNVLSYFIEHAPDTMSKAKYSAQRERSLGLGAMGFHAYLQKNMVEFESEEASKINIEIFEHIYNEAYTESLKLAKERGEPLDFTDARAKGYGGDSLRNLHLIAVAPNASSSILCGNTSPSVEPFAANAYRQNTHNGANIHKNKWLDKLLRFKIDDEAELKKVWKSIVDNLGSVQHLKILNEHEKNVFKTAQELDQHMIVQHAADRQPYIDQAQSINLFFSADTTAKQLHTVHLEAWKLGLKTLYYCRSYVKTRVENINTRFDRSEIKPKQTQFKTELAPGYEIECIGCQG